MIEYISCTLRILVFILSDIQESNSDRSSIVFDIEIDHTEQLNKDYI